MLTLSTFNIQNSKTDNPKEKAISIVNYIKDNKIDILNLQELYFACEQELKQELEKLGYHIYGTYRYKLGIFRSINEKTPIITNRSILSTRTYHLPYLPSTLKRIITKITLEDENFGAITILNTHLDFMFEFAKKRQLKKILKMIDHSSHPIILTGDFNLKTNHKIFQQFIIEMNKRNMIRVETEGKTWKPSKYKRAIDHIFLSKELNIKNQTIIKELEMSDHYPILIQLEENEKNNKFDLPIKNIMVI